MKNKVKNDGPSDCLWLLMVLRFVMLLCYGDPKSVITLKTKNTSCPHGVHHSANAKAWMITEIMWKVLTMLDRKMITEGKKVLLFLDNTPSHPDILQEGLINIKLEFLPKNTTLRLHPCDADIIKNFEGEFKNFFKKTINLLLM